MLLRFLQRWLGKSDGKLYPECLWSVLIEDGLITVTDDRGNVSQVPLDELQAVIIATNDSGPWGADFWWILDRAKGVAASFPEGATGERNVVSAIQELPGFDWDKMGQAIRSTQNASFVVWKRKRGA